MRYKLKNGGVPRKKALFGADGAIMAAATLAAAGMNVKATIDAAKSQAQAVESSARTQAQVVRDQTRNNNNLQQQSMDFTRQQNMNDRLKASKVAVKYGGRPKRNKLSAIPSYGGADAPFTVTDGGGAIPLQTDNNGYGLYELYGNDHEHYHKTKNGKNKSGVGIRFKDGSVVEGEGNQNTNKGEKLYVTPTDAMFISKHSIDGFNPAKAVDNGMNPKDAFAIQQRLKLEKGINDDGSRMKPALRRKALAGMELLDIANQTQYPYNGTANIATGSVYAINNLPQTTVAKCGGHRKLKCGGRPKAEGGYWQNYGGATYAGIGNVLGAGLNMFGNYYAADILGKSYNKAGNLLADAYSQMKGIDMSELSRDDYAPSHVMAVIRSSDTNINPQLERIRRNAESERRNVDASTLSSAARQQRLAGINDRMLERMGEQYAYKDNADEKIRQENAARIQQASVQNAELDSQSRQAYSNARMSLLQYNNNIENSKIAGRAQSLADAMTQTSAAQSNAIVNSANALGTALTGTAQGFANAYTAKQKAEQDFTNVMFGADTSTKIDYLTSKDINNMTDSDKALAQSIYNRIKDIDDPVQKANAAALKNKFGFV